MVAIVILWTLSLANIGIQMNLFSQNELRSKQLDAVYVGFVFNITSANLTANRSQYLRAAVRKLSTG